MRFAFVTAGRVKNDKTALPVERKHRVVFRFWTSLVCLAAGEFPLSCKKLQKTFPDCRMTADRVHLMPTPTPEGGDFPSLHILPALKTRSANEEMLLLRGCHIISLYTRVSKLAHFQPLVGVEVGHPVSCRSLIGLVGGVGAAAYLGGLLLDDGLIIWPPVRRRLGQSSTSAADGPSKDPPHLPRYRKMKGRTGAGPCVCVCV